jgi:hypothetical protein
MALANTAIRNAKPRDRDYKLTDSRGLYLLMTPAGGKPWRLKFRSDGLERKLSLGRYPAVTLSDARKDSDAANARSEGGEDPAAAKRRGRIAAKLSAGTTFGAVALENIEKAEREGRSPANGYSGLPEARLPLSPHVFVRPCELRQAAWSEIDFEAGA